MKTCIIPGTRHEVIEMSPVVRACEGSGAEWFEILRSRNVSRGKLFEIKADEKIIRVIFI